MSRECPLFVAKRYFIRLLKAVESKYNTNLKMHNTKDVKSASKITLLLLHCVRWFQSKNLLGIFPFLIKKCQKIGNARTGTETVNVCIAK